jgi:6-pyruvoyltetrahydropterin/6-carboxytetrahydropterin synthase
MYITRKAEFSASHVCRLAGWSDAENRRAFGEDSHPYGHGHNYVVEVTLAGEPDPVTGMIVDLKQVKQLLEEEIVAPMDHRFLNIEVPPFDSIVPTTENLAREIWYRLDRRLPLSSARLHRVRLYETADCYVDIERDDIERHPSAHKEAS